MIKIIKLFQLKIIFSIIAIITAIGAFFVIHSHAADLTILSDTLSRSRIGQNSNHTIVFTTPSGVATGETIEITFPAGFVTTSVDYTDIDLADDGVDITLDAVASGTTWGAAFAGQVLTLTSDTGTIGATSIVTIEIGTNATFTVAGDQAINNPNSSDTYSISIAGTFGDTGTISVVIISDDQIQVSGDIFPTLDFSISSNTVGFGSIANTNIRYATADGLGSFSEPNNNLPVKLTAGTNAINGLAISIQDVGDNSSAGLYAALAPELIPAAPSTEVLNSSKKYGVYGKNVSNLTLNEGFNNDGVADLAISRTPQTFASSASQINGSLDLALIVAIDATTKPGSYVDTLTLICTGNF